MRLLGGHISVSGIWCLCPSCSACKNIHDMHPMTDMASASYISISQGVPAASAFGHVIPTLNGSCILHFCNLYKFVLFILPFSFEAHTMH
jgi:hypothetical protein